MSLALKNKETELGIIQTGTVSAAMSLQSDTLFIGVSVPDIDAGALGIEYAIDGATFVPIVNIATGADAVILASGSDPAYVDFSDHIRSIPRGSTERKIRFTCTAQATKAVTLTVSENS